ncbi:MAG TPA: DMT family transporter [Ilumatobacteraceae bacterium]|nr:DMT family transporter [Ilumatobacteraceae bacterium]
MGVLLGVVAGVLLGCSDFCATRASRTVNAVSVSRMNLAISGLIAPLLFFVRPVEWTLRDLVLGSLSGFTLAGGLVLLYRGYSVARMGIVAPTSSVLLAAVPVMLDLVRGHEPSTLAASGMGLGLIALALTTYERGGSGSTRIGVFLGIGAGLLFGIAFALTAETSDEAGLSPVFTQRLAGLVLLVALQPLDKASMLAFQAPARRWGIGAGLAAGVAIAALKLGYINGSAGPVSVAASQFATAGVLLSVIFNAERLRPWQAIGVGASGVGVALMALG